MVLQRGKPVHIWGEAAPGEKVTVAFREQTKTATANDEGRWSVKLDPLKAGGPDTFTVSGANELALKDVLVGEVWIGSGQSNMAGGVGSYAKNDEVLAKLAEGSYPQLRLHRGGANRWDVATPEANQRFSALLFAFGQRLQEDLDVPVGLILGAVGGTPSGRWMTADMFAADEQAQAVIKAAAAGDNYEQRLAQHEKALAAWAAKVEEAKQLKKRAPRKPLPPAKVGEVQGGVMGDLYNRFIAPVEGFTIAGVLWDQGEAGTRIQGLDQFYAMGALIGGWRRVWDQGEFPFLYVQKPSGGGCAWDYENPITRKGDAFSPQPSAPPKSNGGLYRELHISIMRHPNTAMVTARDLGASIHPSNKSGYGQRGAQVAAGFVYEKEVEIYGPIYSSHQVKDNAIVLEFTHVGEGLAARHSEQLQGFQIAGEDKVFHWGTAKIEGDTIVVSSDKVKEPVAVRYAWAQRAPWANLFNKNGLPALAFRTDTE